MKRSLFALVAATSILLLVAACGGSAASGGVVIENGVQHLTLKSGTGDQEFRFLPANFTLNAGQVQITYENGGAIIHELMVLDASDPAKLQQFMDAHAQEDSTGVMAEDAVPGVMMTAELEDVETGTSKTTEIFDLPAGTYQIACMKPGHYEAGMYLNFEVK